MDSFRYSLMNTKFPVTYEPDSLKGVVENLPEKASAICVYNNPRGKTKISTYQELRDFARENNYSPGAHVMAIHYPDLAQEIFRGL